MKSANSILPILPERQQSELAVHERMLLQSLPAALYTCDTEGRLMVYNDAAVALWGREPVAGKDLWCGSWRIFHPDGTAMPADKCPMAVTIRDRKPVRGKEIIIERPDGTRRHILPQPELLRDANGRVVGAINMLVDITELKRAEGDLLRHQEALRQSEEFARSILASSPDCIKVLDRNGYVLTVNEGGMKALEIDDFSEFKSSPWVNFWKEEDHAKARHALHEALNGGTATFQGVCPTAKGAVKWWEVIVTPIRDDASNAVTRVLCISRDITARKHIEDKLHESLKLAEDAKEKAMLANRRKDEFMANMSHDLRTPLNAIIGLGHILSTTRPLTEKQNQCIETLQISSESLLALINDLLDLTKIEDGNLQLESIPFDLKRVLDDAVSIVSVRANEKRLALNVNYDARLEDTFLGDPYRFKQVVLNLLSNAVKFTTQGGIAVLVEMTQDNKSHAAIEIRVIDSGIGIPPDKQASIFSKFSQADTSITRQYGGTGLGLTISKKLVTMMGGTLTVESKEGEGATFIINLTLPRAAFFPELCGSEPAVHTHSHIADAKPAPHVLLVEDYPANVLVASSCMDLLGYSYDIAHSGEEAIRMVEQSPDYDIVLMDVQMPGMDGFTATRTLRELERKRARRRVPIIGVTAYALMGDKRKCIDSGMDDYLSKPYDPDTLKQKIEALTRKKQQAAAQ